MQSSADTSFVTMNTLQIKKQHVVVLVLIGISSIGWIILLTKDCNHGMYFHPKNMKQTFSHEYSIWPPFSNMLKHDRDFYKHHCFGDKFSDMNIALLYDAVQEWKRSNNPECRKLYNKFQSIYSVRQRSGGVIIPKTFEPKVRKWLGNNDELFKETAHQTITLVYNELTNEHTIFNPIRAKRPIVKPDEPERDYIEKQQAEAKKSCDFCDPLKYTAEDMFGRIENDYAFSAANTFKYDSWHSLFITKKHHPLDWKEKDLLGMFDVASKWFDKVNSINSNYTYPVLIWDLNIKAGASQIHPHTHGSMDIEKYYGMMERWRRAGQDYFNIQQGDVNYFTDLLEIHNAFGLTATYGTAAAFASITPKKDNEVVIFSPEANEDFFKLIYYVTRAYIDDMDKLCFSAGIAFPQLGKGLKAGNNPAFARFITRGAVAEIRSDISSLELFAASQVNRDPFIVIDFIKESVKKRS